MHNINQFMNKKYNLDYKVDPSFQCIKYVKAHNENNFTKHSYKDHIVRADLCSSLISILFNTNNIDTSLYSIKKFIDKSDDPAKLQFCIKIDNESNVTEEFLKKISKYKSNFIIISSPKGRGYLDLWQWINFLYKISSRKSKFVMNISDEMYVNEDKWDKLLEKYLNLTDDRIFRLRTSVYKNRNYSTLFECGYAPDTTAIYSRKYIELQGDFSPCFGPDNGQQFVAYYLATVNYPRHYQFLRDFVIETISFKGQGTNKGLEGESRNQRLVDNYLLWINMFKFKFQSIYLKRARKIQVEILKFNFPDLNIVDNIFKQRFELWYTDENNRTNIFLKLSYKISKIKHFWHNIGKINFFKWHTGYDRPLMDGVLAHTYVKVLKKFPKSKPQKKISDSILIRVIDDFIDESLKINKAINSRIGVLEEFKIIEFTIFFIGLILSTIIFVATFPSLKTNLLRLNQRFKIIKLKIHSRKNSFVISNNKIDQSKTIVIKGD